MDINKKLNDLSLDIEDYQALIFKHLSFSKDIAALRLDRSKHSYGSQSQRIKTEHEYDLKIEKLIKEKSKLKPHCLIKIFNQLFLNQNFSVILEFEKRLNIWLNPIIEPLFLKRKETNNQINTISEKEKELEEKGLIFEEIKIKNQKEIDELKKGLMNISNEFEKKMVNKDYLMRELLSVYGDDHFLENFSNFRRTEYIDSYSQYILKGNEIEIIDGDYNQFQGKILNDIFQSLEQKQTQREFLLFVLSVIGPQSTK